MDGEPGVAERGHQGDHVAGQRAGVVAAVRLFGQTDATLVGHDDREGLGQLSITCRQAYQLCGQP